MILQTVGSTQIKKQRGGNSCGLRQQAAHSLQYQGIQLRLFSGRNARHAYSFEIRARQVGEPARPLNSRKERNAAMTLKEIEALPKEMLLMEDIAPFLEANPQSLRDQAQNDPNKLGFPVIVIGARVKAPKSGFVHFMKYGRTAP